MTEQPSFASAQNIAILHQLLERADANKIADFDFYYANANDADLPYNRVGHESGFAAQVRENNLDPLEKYVVAYQPIRHGKEMETFITYYDVDGYETSIYRMPASRVFFEAIEMFLSRRAEFLIWRNDAPTSFPEELENSRRNLLEIRRRGLHISPEQLR